MVADKHALSATNTATMAVSMIAMPERVGGVGMEAEHAMVASNDGNFAADGGDGLDDVVEF